MFFPSRRWVARLRGPGLFILLILVVEFLDEFIDGAGKAALPQIKAELDLNYDQIGLLFSIPYWISILIEPVFALWSDTGRLRFVIIGGGVGFSVASLLIAGSTNFGMLLVAYILFFPASGAFVSMAQVALMAKAPNRTEQNMARWTLAGSVGWVVAGGALAFVGVIGLGWRSLFVVAALVAFGVMLMLSRFSKAHFRTTDSDEGEQQKFGTVLRGAIRAARRPDVLRWLILLEFSNLMLDVLFSYLALYFVEGAGFDPNATIFAVSAWTVIGLIGDAALIPLLERVDGLRYLRVSVVIELVLFPALLLVPGFWPKVIIAALLGFFNTGWYTILEAKLYDSMPNQLGTSRAIGSMSATIGGLLPLLIGLAAERIGISVAIWLCWLGPWVLLVGLPRRSVPREQ